MNIEGIWNGAGTWDALASVPPFDIYVQKTVTVEPRAGNPEPTIFREGAYRWRNRVGLRNPGIVAYVEHVLPRLAELRVPVVASCLGYTEAEWRVLLSVLGSWPSISAVELNLSCPNTAACESPVSIASLARTAAPDLTLIAKLSPLAHRETVRSVALYVDALCLCNSLPSPFGGVSGAPVHEHALRQVEQARRGTSTPIVGLGGVVDRESYERMRNAGASAVAIGAANLDGPGLATSLRSGAVTSSP